MKNFLFAALTFAIATNANKLELGAPQKPIAENCAKYQYGMYEVENIFRKDCTAMAYTKGTPPVKYYCKVVPDSASFKCVPQ